jgi:hypothetical protein
MPEILSPKPPRIRAIIFDMDNTLFDFVAAKQHACREVAKFLGRDDWEALFNCFINSPHGFESHENIRDYFNLCGLLEECSTRKGRTNRKKSLAISPGALPLPGRKLRRVIRLPRERMWSGSRSPR